MERIRPAGNRGRFYPADPGEIRAMITRWNAVLDRTGTYPAKLKPVAIVAPHAGYVFSGFTANAVHRFWDREPPERILVVGPSHHIYFRGISAANFMAYETPFGPLDGSKELFRRLAGIYPFTFEPRAHTVEHSTETQFPFIKYYAPQTQITELIYGDIPYTALVPLLQAALQWPGTAVVISTDLSHYHDQQTANRLDRACLEGVQQGNLALLENPCQACGKTGLMALVRTAKDLGLRPTLIDYRTSGDVTGDYSAVVGYMSAAYTP
jgi:AmmeMemoRadiSam system protein B